MRLYKMHFPHYNVGLFGCTWETEVVSMRNFASRSVHTLHTVNMSEGPILSTVLQYSIPLMLSGVLQLVFNAADTIVVGRFSGKLALAAVGSVGSLYNLLVCLFIGFSVGVNVLTARYAGGQMDREVSETVHTAVLLALLGGIGIGLIGFLAARPMLTLMGSPDDVIDLATLYMQIIFLGLPVQLVYNFCAAILRSVGDTKRPLYFLTVAGIVNVLLNLLFVIGLQMSVAGVALATDLSQGVAVLLIVRSLMHSEGAIRLYPRRPHLNLPILRQIVAIGLPAGIQSSMFSISNVIIQSSVNSFGSATIAANAAASNIGNFVYQALNTFQQSVTSFVGQNMGARKPKRVIESMKACHFWSVLFGLVLGPLSCLFGRGLLSLFSTDPEVIEIGIRRLWVVNAPYFLCGLMDIMTGTLRGIGYSFLPMIVSILGACVFRIIWILTIFQAVHTLPCLMLSYPVSWLLTFLVHTAVFLKIWPRVLSRFTEEERNAV